MKFGFSARIASEVSGAKGDKVRSPLAAARVRQ
jgi:hypothetical protein